MSDFLLNILRGINDLLGNYGWSVVVFTICVRLLLLPFDYKSRVGMRRTAKLQPKIQALQKKYAKDQQKLNQKMNELYRNEHASPLSGCLPMLLSYPILIWMFTAMRSFANEQVVRQVLEMLQHPDQQPILDGWLWIKNLWMPDSPFSAAVVDLNTMKIVPKEIWLKVINADTLSALAAQYPALSSLTLESFTTDTAGTIQLIASTLSGLDIYKSMTAGVPGWTNVHFLITSLTVMKEYNGLFLLPIFSAVSNLAMSSMTPQQPTPVAADDERAKATQSTGKMMKWFFPIFSLWICASSNGAFALYWVTSNLIMMATTFLINKYLDHKEAKTVIAGEGTVK